MTILVSFASENAIIMCADRVITEYFLGNNGDFQEYDVGTKMFTFPGIGIVSTWGDRDHNRIGHFLREQNIQQRLIQWMILRALVRDYLENHLQPKENNMDEVGFILEDMIGKELRNSTIFFGVLTDHELMIN